MLKLLKLYKTVGHFMVKSVLLVKCGSGCICNSKFPCWCVWCTSWK